MNDFCGMTMRFGLKRESDFDDETRNDPTAALEQICGFMFVPAKAKHEHNALDKTIERFMVDAKQEMDDSICREILYAIQ